MFFDDAEGDSGAEFINGYGDAKVADVVVGWSFFESLRLQLIALSTIKITRTLVPIPYRTIGEPAGHDEERNTGRCNQRERSEHTWNV